MVVVESTTTDADDGSNVDGTTLIIGDVTILRNVPDSVIVDDGGRGEVDTTDCNIMVVVIM